jgi:hypothetical protein
MQKEISPSNTAFISRPLLFDPYSHRNANVSGIVICGLFWWQKWKYIDMTGITKEEPTSHKYGLLFITERFLKP